MVDNEPTPSTRNATVSEQRRSNRERYPEVAALYDQLCAVFGADQVKAKTPYVLKPGESWVALPGQRWPVKAPRAKPFKHIR